MAKWFRAILKKLLLLSIGLGIGLVAAELCLRVLGVSYPLPYAPDPYCGTRLQAGFEGWTCKEGGAWIRINRYGFRQGDRGPKKPPNTFRVAVLGDSFIEAFQVPEDQTFCAALERELGQCEFLDGRRVEVLNFGVSGYGTAQELLMLRHYVWPYEPDLVVLAFFAGNDLRNNSAELEPYKVRPFFRLGDGRLVLDRSFLEHPDYRKAHTTLVRWKVAWINRLRLLQLANHVRDTWRQRRAAPAQADASKAGLDAYALAEPQAEPWKRAWTITEQLVLETAAESRRHQAAFLLMSIGCDFQAHPEATVAEAVRKQLDGLDVSYSDLRLQRLGTERGFPVIPLAEPMRRFAVQHRVFLYGFANTQLGVGHWNADGHRVAGQIVAGALCDGLQHARKSSVNDQF
jgi:hypothetical protein